MGKLLVLQVFADKPEYWTIFDLMVDVRWKVVTVPPEGNMTVCTKLHGFIQ